MLIPSMTFYEMYEELIADRAKLEYKRQQLTPKAIKSLRKANSFPAWEWFEYTIPSRHNSYILFFYAANRQAAENPIFDNFSIVSVTLPAAALTLFGIATIDVAISATLKIIDNAFLISVS